MCLLMGNDGVTAQKINAQIWQYSLLGLGAVQEIISLYMHTSVCVGAYWAAHSLARQSPLSV